MCQHILLPTDGSVLSNKAIPQGIELAKSIGARVTGVAYTGVHVLHDHPHQAILDEAKQRGCDLIVMASHGTAGWPPSCSAAKRTRS